ncbi:hypothetical protein GOODEAATRI_015561 [Goodea atripinnis]|uniref:Uncharacterized protein n=1 Tax=Goodea atripinnis TaxID=208336 RepID=A0ABV0PNU3_9TELE
MSTQCCYNSVRFRRVWLPDVLQPWSLVTHGDAPPGRRKCPDFLGCKYDNVFAAGCLLGLSKCVVLQWFVYRIYNKGKSHRYKHYIWTTPTQFNVMVKALFAHSGSE